MYISICGLYDTLMFFNKQGRAVFLSFYLFFLNSLFNAISFGFVYKGMTLQDFDKLNFDMILMSPPCQPFTR